MLISKMQSVFGGRIQFLSYKNNLLDTYRYAVN